MFIGTLYSSDVQQHAGGQAYDRREEQKRVQDEHVGVAHGPGRRIALMQMRYVRGRLPAGTPLAGLLPGRRLECGWRGRRHYRGGVGGCGGGGRSVGAWVVDRGHRGAGPAAAARVVLTGQ